MQFDLKKHLFRQAAACVAITSCMGSAAAMMSMPADGRPPMPGMTHGPSGSPGMIHTEVFVSGTTLEVEIVGQGANAGAEDQPVVMGVAMGFDAPFDVLNGKLYNAQYGWLPSSNAGNELQSLPLDRVIAVELVSLGASNPSALETYDGGNGMQLRPTNGSGDLLPTQHTMNALFANVGDVWLWDDFIMQHNWYAATTPGLYSATYDVYVSDTNGVRDTAYGSDTVTLRFNAVPEPATAATLLGGLALLIRRRKATA
ncbi:MAG: PEP-CTERM sorting domain-containing protein [Planctomycetota bacterium]